MANHKSALKRHLQNRKRRLRNRMVKTRVRTSVKKVYAVKKAGSDAAGVGSELRAAQSIIDKAVKKRVIHPRTAARKVSRLAKSVNRLAAS